jgi:hypothetical protein
MTLTLTNICEKQLVEKKKKGKKEKHNSTE